MSRKRTIVRRSAVDLPSAVHTSVPLRAGFEAHVIPFTGDNAVAHYWATGYRDLIAKHVRYLRLEGAARRDKGLVTGYRDIASTLPQSFSESFVAREGFRDGPRGLALSLLWAIYSTGAKIALLRELKRARA
jgi:hypothetical protein